MGSPALRSLARLVVLVAFIFVIVSAFLGPPSVTFNVAPWVLYITFWVGLVPASLLLGPVWRIVNPLRTIHRLVARAARLDPATGLVASRDGAGPWPAAGVLAGFAWIELVFVERDDPVVVGTLLVGYAVGHLVAALVFGEDWFARGDGFEVYSTVVARLSPFGRRTDGRLVLRNPLDGLETVRRDSGTVAVAVVLLGATAYDGLTRTQVWQRMLADPERAMLPGTLGLFATVGLVAGLYVGATSLAGHVIRPPRSDLPPRFAHSLVPLVVGYAVAHYFSLFAFDGQQPLRILSDPLGSGADYLGTATWDVNYTWVSPRGIALVQVGAILLGHLVAVVAAHDRAVRLLPGPAALRAQFPLLGAMVIFTVGRITLLLGA